jgi:transposase
MRIPIEMRKKMVAAVERGEAVNAVARRFEVTPQGLRKLLRTVRSRGDLTPRTPGPKKPIKLTPQDDAKMLELIEREPGITLNAIRAQLSATTGTVVAESTVCRRLKKLGVSLKKRA